MAGRCFHASANWTPAHFDSGGFGGSRFWLLPLLRFIVAHGLPRAITAALELMGTAVGPLRAPLRALPPEHVAELRQLLVALEVLPGGRVT